jgi:hypothetical protein
MDRSSKLKKSLLKLSRGIQISVATSIYQQSRVFNKQPLWSTESLLTGHCTPRWHPHSMGLLENARCRKCDRKNNPPTINHTLSVLNGCRLEIFGSAL